MRLIFTLVVLAFSLTDVFAQLEFVFVTSFNAATHGAHFSLSASPTTCVGCPCLPGGVTSNGSQSAFQLFDQSNTNPLSGLFDSGVSPGGVASGFLMGFSNGFAAEPYFFDTEGEPRFGYLSFADNPLVPTFIEAPTRYVIRVFQRPFTLTPPSCSASFGALNNIATLDINFVLDLRSNSTGTVRVPAGGHHVFSLNQTNGVRFFANGNEVVSSGGVVQFNEPGTFTMTARKEFANKTTTVSLGTVIVDPVPVFIVAQSPSYTCIGSSGGFLISADNFSSLAHPNNVFTLIRWEMAPSGGSTFTPVPNAAPYVGQGTFSLGVQSVTADMRGQQFRLVIGTPNGIYTSPGVSFNIPDQVGVGVTDAGGVGAQWDASLPRVLNVCPSNTITLTANATPRTGSLTYQWQHGSEGAFSDIPGATSQILTLNIPANPTGGAANALHDREYRAIVRDGCGAPTQGITAPIRLNVLRSPHFTAQPPPSTTACSDGNPVSITATAMVTGPLGSLQYQWQFRDPSDVNVWHDISNATGGTRSHLKNTLS